MKVQAQALTVGQSFTYFGVTYVAQSVKTVSDTVFVTVESTNPFVSSSFCAFNTDAMVEVA